MSQFPRLTERIDTIIDSTLAEKRIVGTVVLVARDGETVYRRAAGFSDREAARPMHENAIFRLASVTKPLVTAAAMRLVEEGVLTLDRPVTRWLPDFGPRLLDGTVPQITIHHLLTHTSGLSYRFLEPPESAYHHLNVSDGLDQPGLAIGENLVRLTAAPLAFPPGTAWRYSLAIDVLGAVMEKATGTPLPELVARLVTEPLGLTDTAFGVVDPARLVTPYAHGSPEPVAMTEGMAVPLWDSDGAMIFAPGRILDRTSYPSGGAGMASTAGDILAFLEAFHRGGTPILKQETVAEMMRDQVGSQAEPQGPGWGFGYGWAVLVDPAGTGTPQARGTLQWGGAYGHSWFVDPANGLSVVAFTNTAFEGSHGSFTTEIRDAAYG
jgi:CubicO group peptidase (beta-lactamase class C family)